MGRLRWNREAKAGYELGYFHCLVNIKELVKDHDLDFYLATKVLEEHLYSINSWQYAETDERTDPPISLTIQRLRKTHKE
ncbi:MAG: hypothetical protein GTO18_12345 [Anaerolineales bacterium]|nr:hypothetical protein [Anaerolineales bacterium]